ncbi:PREDICTED: myeloid cell surface antigen CD33-like [Miniopterus natalensis]|uniref:myeloid cell surface antigen CD33-like n=1 Tax=Miniopterus natalensis TaxID=291302 RepID=UPI0007A6A736|nr:PREDICTED: myeloid cell surface antigen CD33-like [Miniopterus natalensis]
MLLLLLLLLPGSLAQDKRYQMKVNSPVTVQEGLCVSVHCSFTYPRTYANYPAYGFWFREGADIYQDAAVATNHPHREVQEGARGRFHLLWDPQAKNCSLDIRDARRTDDGLYFFRVQKGTSLLYSYAWNKFSLHVTALTHTPDILITGALESGCPRNLTCSVPWACERGSPPIFSWTSAAHTSLGPRTRFSSVLTLTPRPQDHGTNLTCQVHFPAAGVTVERTIQLNVTCAPQNPTTGDCLGIGSGEPRTRAKVVQGAIGGAGVTALLAVCLGLIYFVVKTHRKKAAREGVVVDSIYTLVGPASLGHQKKPKLNSPADSTGSAGAPSTSGLEPELYYASIHFQGTKPPQENTHTAHSTGRTQ